MDDRWHIVEDLFHRASECEPAQRDAKLREWCAGDHELLAEVQSLLAAESAASDCVIAPKPEADLWIGRTVGSFQIERLLGRGGMGAVYFGRRVGADFQQDVAIKVISATRLTSAWMRQRFLVERQVLASLNHPYIARLIDGGVTGEGESYIVMEYIEGTRLDLYCEQNSASVRDIVRLLVQLCDAVAYAHRNLIVHRDLKPANVLVTNTGDVKLLDFGTVKLMSPDAGPSDPTRLGMRALTPEYASPEQLFGQPVTAASDVYSLGVVLYRLLTGRLPFDLTGLSPAGVMETVFDTRAVSTTIVRPERASELRGDLDAIVLKALRPEIAARYASVDDLGSDLRNFLEHRAVHAREGSLRYHAAKFARRHAGNIVAVCAVVLAVAAGLGATLRQARIATVEAEKARAGFRNVQGLSRFLLFDFYDQVKQLEGSTEVQRRLVAQALGYLDGLARDSAGDPEVQLDLLEAYTKMGNVLGNPYERNLGDAPGALKSLEKAVAIGRALQARGKDNAVVLKRLALAERSVGEVQFAMGNPSTGVQFSNSAAQRLERLAAGPDATILDIQEAASTYDSLGDQYGLRGASSLGDSGAALQSYNKALQLQTVALGKSPGNIRSMRGVAICRMKIANLQRDTEPDAAIAGYQEAIATLAKLPEQARSSIPIRRLTVMIRQKIGSLLSDIGRPAESLPHLKAAEELHAELAAQDPRDTRARYDLATTHYYLAEAYYKTGNVKAARDEHRRVIGILDDVLKRDPSNVAWQGHRAESIYNLGYVERELGNRALGDKLVREGLDTAVQVALTLNSSASDLARAASHLLEVEPESWRDPRRALELSERAVTESKGANPEFLITLAQAQIASGKRDEAKKTLQTAIAMLPPIVPGTSPPRLRRNADAALASLKTP